MDKTEFNRIAQVVEDCIESMSAARVTAMLQMFERVKKFTRDVDGVFKSIVMISIGMDKKQRILGSQRNVWRNQSHSMIPLFFYDTQVHLFVQRCIIDNVLIRILLVGFEVL
jgi:hypothetical protein